MIIKPAELFLSLKQYRFWAYFIFASAKKVKTWPLPCCVIRHHLLVSRIHLMSYTSSVYLVGNISTSAVRLFSLWIGGLPPFWKQGRSHLCRMGWSNTHLEEKSPDRRCVLRVWNDLHGLCLAASKAQANPWAAPRPPGTSGARGRCWCRVGNKKIEWKSVFYQYKATPGRP